MKIYKIITSSYNYYKILGYMYYPYDNDVFSKVYTEDFHIIYKDSIVSILIWTLQEIKNNEPTYKATWPEVFK